MTDRVDEIFAEITELENQIDEFERKRKDCRRRTHELLQEIVGLIKGRERKAA
jgi:hypothetical protein